MFSSSCRLSIKSLLFIVSVVCLGLNGFISTCSRYQQRDVAHYNNLAHTYRYHAKIVGESIVRNSQIPHPNPKIAAEQAASESLSLHSSLRWAAIAEERANRCARSYLHWLLRSDQRSRVAIPDNFGPDRSTMFDRFVINDLMMIDPSIFILMLLPAALVVKERVTIRRERRHPRWLVLVAMILAVTATSILGCRDYLQLNIEKLSDFPPPILISMFLPLILIVVQRLTIRDVHRHPRWLLPCAAALVVLVVAILGCRYIFWWTRPSRIF